MPGRFGFYNNKHHNKSLFLNTLNPFSHNKIFEAPGGLKKAGKTASEIGGVITVIGALTGQPEIAAVGTALGAGGQGLGIGGDILGGILGAKDDPSKIKDVVKHGKRLHDHVRDNNGIAQDGVDKLPLPLLGYNDHDKIKKLQKEKTDKIIDYMPLGKISKGYITNKEGEIEELVEIEKKSENTEEEILKELQKIKTELDNPDTTEEFLNDLEDLSDVQQLKHYLKEHYDLFTSLNPNDRNRALNIISRFV